MMFDHFQTHPVLGGVFDRLLPRVTLINKSQLIFWPVATVRLGPARPPVRDPVRWPASPSPPANVPAYLPSRWSFEPLRFLCPSKPARPPLSGVDWSVRLSKITALGASVRPATTRSTRRKSSARASKQPARSQRCVCCCTAVHVAGRWASSATDNPRAQTSAAR